MQNIQSKNPLFRPLMGEVLNNRMEGMVIFGAAALQVCLVWAHLPGWPCPFKSVFGIPCPGCGLSTACVHLLTGDWKGALTIHAFAPLTILVLAAVLVISLLPEPTRLAVVKKLRSLESQTGFSALILAGLFIYWGLRLLHFV